MPSTIRIIWAGLCLPGIETPTRNNMKETANKISNEKFFICTFYNLTTRIVPQTIHQLSVGMFVAQPNKIVRL